MLDQGLNAPASRWISVIFLQRERADDVLSMIDRSGVAATIAHLQQWDYGEATTDAALTNGYVYDRIPAGSTDRTVEDDCSPYALTYSAQFRYVSFLRRHPDKSESEFVSAPGASARQPARACPAPNPWLTTPGRSTNKTERTVAL
jgi:hypothetical protein